MIPATDMTAFSLRDIAGESLIQETPYPVVAPRSMETLALVLHYARVENLHVLPLGTGSSFDSDFQLPNVKVVAVLSGGLSGIEKLSPTGFRILSGTPVARLFRSGAAHERKTLGGLIAGAAGVREDVEKAIWSNMLKIEIMNGDGELLQFAGPSRASAHDPGLASLLFGSQGRMGVIVSVDLRGPLPLEIPENDARPVGAVLSPNEAVTKRAELARVLDPNGLFAW